MYLGIDIGSSSVKGVLLNEDALIIEKKYIRNTGIIDSINKLIKPFKKYTINGIGITGSGRGFGNIIFNADLVKNEIIAHAVASMTYHPEVKTIFEVGGEDSKLSQIEEGVVTNFAMNTACAGGTGSVIETIAGRLGVKIEDVGDLAFKSKNAISIAGKCGIFSQSTAINKRNIGVPVEDILMGVCKALVNNYFTILVRNLRIETPAILQGAVAWNRAVIKCFEDILQANILVPDYPELMGAIGMALLLKEQGINNPRKIGINTDYKTEIRFGANCSNRCEIIDVKEGGEILGSIGNRCSKCII